MSQFPNGLPSIGTTSGGINGLQLIPKRMFLADSLTGDWYPGGKVLDGFSARDPGNTIRVDEIRPGLELGKISNSTASGSSGTAAIGQYGAAIIGTLKAAATAGQLSFTLNLASSSVELTRRIGSAGTLVLTGQQTSTASVLSEALAFSAVGATSGIVTCSAVVNNYVAGGWVGANDGSATLVTFLCGDPTNIRVTDVNGSNMAAPLRYIPIGHTPVDTTQLINYPTTSVFQLFYKAALRVAAPAMTFSDVL